MLGVVHVVRLHAMVTFEFCWFPGGSTGVLPASVGLPRTTGASPRSAGLSWPVALLVVVLWFPWGHGRVLSCVFCMVVSVLSLIFVFRAIGPSWPFFPLLILHPIIHNQTYSQTAYLRFHLEDC